MGLMGPPTGEKSRGRKVRFGGVSASRRCVRTPAPCVPAAPLNFQRISRWLSDVTFSPGTRRAPVKGETRETLSTASGWASHRLSLLQEGPALTVAVELTATPRCWSRGLQGGGGHGSGTHGRQQGSGAHTVSRFLSEPWALGALHRGLEP